MPNIRFLIWSVSLIHMLFYRATGGLIGGYVGAPVLLLTTVGRKSGKARTVPLLYLREGSQVALVASNGGDDRHPAWWLNLRASPAATIQIRRSRERVTARQGSPDEKRLLWPRFVKMHGGYKAYQQRTRREIPVVILEPETGGERDEKASAQPSS